MTVQELIEEDVSEFTKNEKELELDMNEYIVMPGNYIMNKNPTKFEVEAYERFKLRRKFEL